MKYLCNVVKDLLPLYCDGVCSEESKNIVEEHLEECTPCKELLKKMQNNPYDDLLRKERNEVIQHHTKNIRKKVLLLIGPCASAIALITCFIVNLCTLHRLDWFFIVLTSIMVFEALTAVPFIVKKNKLFCTLAAFTASLLLLFMTCCLYTGGTWFWVASVAVIFGLVVVFLPIVLNKTKLKTTKGLTVMLADTILLYLLIMVCGFYGNYSYPYYWHNALLITSSMIIFPWILFVVIRYFKANGLIKAGLCVIIGGFFTSLSHDIVYLITDGIWQLTFKEANLLIWNNNVVINANVYLLMIITCCVVGLFLLTLGVIKSLKR